MGTQVETPDDKVVYSAEWRMEIRKKGQERWLFGEVLSENKNIGRPGPVVIGRARRNLRIQHGRDYEYRIVKFRQIQRTQTTIAPITENEDL